MPQSTVTKKLTLVTVAFEQSRVGLIMQARSLRLYCPEDLVEEIIVVDNSKRNQGMPWISDVLAEYGKLRDLVRIIPASDIAEVSLEEDGWWSQQALKVEVARHVKTEFYLVLDCKHHLVKPLLPDFVILDGRLRVRAANYVGHPLIKHLAAALDHFRLSYDNISFFPTTTPPFPFDVATALACTAYGKAKAGSLIAFMRETNITEFFLYSAYLLSLDRLNVVHSLHTIPYPNFWPVNPTAAAAAELISASRNSESPFIGLHRRALANADRQALYMIANYWVTQGLVATPSEAFRLLTADKPSISRRIVRKMRGFLKI